ncbi:MAG: alcohol dehydrogenase catalytic domain-containing protein [Deltaproteobacteria bacterium]|nr:alcohol dehydrogenase catalytic domain-containing protein [Deltaproteobacteria bacterium]
MRAIVYDGQLKLVTDYPVPNVPTGWARIRVHKAGICKTDMEIMRGYQGFTGVLGHEFVGIIDQCDHPDWIGKRAVGEINVGCGECEQCQKGMARHCPRRKTLGIHHLDGCMADYCVLPLSNLHLVPDSLADHRAVLIEPLSAAFEILDQIEPKGSEQAVVLGDGPLGILCAWALTTVLRDVALIGHHPAKLEKAAWRDLRTYPVLPAGREGGVDIVVEATGSEKGLAHAMVLCRPRGTIVLKSTTASEGKINLSPLVVNEQTLIGSRCGRFEVGLGMLASFPDMPLERLIWADYPIGRALEAFEQAMQPDTLKIVLDISGSGDLSNNFRNFSSV